MTEFTIHGVVCQVLPVEHLTESLDDNQKTETTVHIIGSCTLNGKQYVLISRQDANSSVLKETVSASDLLTRRELQVAMMVCQGRGNKQIAYRLHLSEWTVSSYLRRIYSKLGVRTRTAMVTKLLACQSGSSPSDNLHVS